jgi:hypothetical protein
VGFLRLLLTAAKGNLQLRTLQPLWSEVPFFFFFWRLASCSVAGGAGGEHWQRQQEVGIRSRHPKGRGLLARRVQTKTRKMTTPVQLKEINQEDAEATS